MRYAIAVWLVVWTSNCYGQAPLERGSAAAFSAINQARIRSIQQNRKFSDATKAGEQVFGKHQAMEYDEGTLNGAFDCTTFRIGDWGRAGTMLETMSKVSANSCLVMPAYRGASVVLIRGLDMTKMSNGLKFVLPCPIVIQETYTYTTTAGTTNTVLVWDCDPAKVKAHIKKVHGKAVAATKARLAAIEAAKWRKWKTKDGKFSVEAKFIGYKAGKAHLEKRGGKQIAVSMALLTPKDRAYVRAEMRARTKARR